MHGILCPIITNECCHYRDFKKIVNKKNKIRDPHAKREAKKYENPIPSREYILQYLDELGRPASFAHLVSALSLNQKDETVGLEYRLRAMVRDGQLLLDRRGRYCLINKVELISGRVVGHPDGYGFVIPDQGDGDLFLSAREMRKVMHNDRVLVREKSRDRRGKREAMIHEVIERNTQQVVGRFFIEDGMAFVEPDNKKLRREIHIPPDAYFDAKDGQIVLAAITRQPSQRAQPVGKIIEVLGDHMAPGMEIDVALRAHDIPYEWPQTVLDEMAVFSDTINPDDIAGRADIRELNLVTIDGADAQDFDDAVYCEPRPKGGWRLFVAIADVSHYVTLDSALDTAALSRGNSVYFPGRVVPMLPEVLSNGLCSLKPHVDRLCMVCEMSISAQGKLTRSRFYPATMHSKARLTYSEVASMLLDNNTQLQKKYEHVWDNVQHLHALYLVLQKARQQRGAIEFDSEETRIVFGEHKKIEKIIPLVRNDAHRLIEECMLLANVATAKFLEKEKIPSLYRVHEPPAEDKVKELREFLGELGLTLRGGKKPHTKYYTEILEATHDRPDVHIIQTVILRSLTQAHYHPKNVGHFGLAFKEYAHFTSPIRRYPDLLVHRAIRHALSRQPVDEFAYDNVQMESLGKHCSVTERRADDATRDVVDWLKCEYIQDRVGEEFDGVICGVTNFGLFVELKSIYVQGLVHVTSLKNDYYQFDALRHRLQGERTGKTYRLGDPLRVMVARVNLDDRKIDFELADPS